MSHVSTPLLAACALALACNPIPPVAEPEGTARFDGHALLALSDADMVATAYADGVLGRVEGIDDALASLALPLSSAAPRGSAAVSNSVTAWPQIAAVSAARIAYVIETRAPAPPGIERYDDVTSGFPIGTAVSVVDVADPASPRVRQRVPIGLGHTPRSVDLSPDARWLLVDVRDGPPLAVAEVRPDGSLGAFAPVEIADHDRSLEIDAVRWHPSGRFVAVTARERDCRSRVAFFSVSRDATGRPTHLAPHGATLRPDACASLGRFTRDGRFYLFTDVGWSGGAAGFLLNGPGALLSVAFDASDAAAHRVVARVDVGLSPEGWAIDPHERLVVTVDMNRTYLPDSFPARLWPGRRHPSLTLLRFDAETGLPERIASYGFVGLLPEDAVFDADGDALAVAIFHDREPRPERGWIELWRVRDGSPPALERSALRLPVGRGVHDLEVAR